ncbi:hypothetical protein [Acetitomaculum ruminis]|nr:hypothetical protein [Acetitomaculum ruminis]
MRRIIKTGIFIIIFLLSAIVTFILTDKEARETKVAMSKAVFPIISFNYGEKKVNYLHGYEEEKKLSNVRGPVIAADNAELSFNIQDGDMIINKVKYEIVSLDMKKTYDSGEVKNFTSGKSANNLKLNKLKLKDKNKEYGLVIELVSNDESIWYYSRVTASNSGCDKILKFAGDFSNAALAHDRIDGFDVSYYLESDVNSNNYNNSYGYVDIKSSYEMVKWGNLDVKLKNTPEYYISEINDYYVTIDMDFIVELNEKNYEVKEYYRVKYVNGTYYLLSYDRIMNSIYTNKTTSVSDKTIDLGVVNDDIDFRSNGTGTIVSFVQNASLYSYNSKNSTLYNVFSFSDSDDYEPREDCKDHSIKILSMDEVGNIDFVVSGYMNRGIHEGESGIAVYRFDIELNYVEERAFINSTKSYPLLKKSQGELLYLNNLGDLYIVFENTLYKISLYTEKIDVVMENINDDCYVVNSNEGLIAWHKSNSKYNETNIEVYDMESEKSYEINASDSQKIMAIGFIGSDFIYGTANDSDIITTAGGEVIFAMCQLDILNNSQNIKNYARPGAYITEALLNGEGINIKLSTKTPDGGYVEAATDSIVNSQNKDDENDTRATLSAYQDETLLSNKKIVLSQKPEKERISIETPKVISSVVTEINLEKKQDKEIYTTYKGKEALVSTASPAIAIKEAAINSGVVVDSKLNYIFKKGAKPNEAEVEDINLITNHSSSLGNCIAMILAQKHVDDSDVDELISQGKSGHDILSEKLNKKVYDLSGCDINTVLYFVNQGYPVMAMTDSSNVVLITAYTPYKVTILDPNKNQSYTLSMESADNTFKEVGNVFLAVL